MTHVGIERALAGSLAHSPDGRLPTPPSHGECTAAEPEPKTIDITPTWASLIGILACLIERGGESRRTAIAELTRLAEFADARNAESRHRIALLEVARVALSSPDPREIVAVAMDISDEEADRLLAEADRLLGDGPADK
jgi:hypothetical protein